MESLFHISSIENLRLALQHKILSTWHHPAIEPCDGESYSQGENRQCFLVRDSFVGDYRITIEKVS